MPSSEVAVSSSRSEVVPTATMRPPPAAGTIELFRGLGGDLAPLGVHPVVVGIVRLDRQEGSRPDMQSERDHADARRA